jgi:hypothetical protein
MFKKMAIAFGAVLVLVGIVGFVPGITPNEHLLGIFHVNAAHNIVHLLSGLVALACGLTSAHAAQTFFRTFGVVYGLIALLGFVGGDRPIFGIISNNLADAWLHTGIAVVSLLLGFVLRELPPSLDRHQPQRA